MCHGFSTRISQGGSIAVLRPTRSFYTLEPNASEEMQLLFQNTSDLETTQIEIKGLDGAIQDCQHAYWVVIQYAIATFSVLPLTNNDPVVMVILVPLHPLWTVNHLQIRFFHSLSRQILFR